MMSRPPQRPIKRPAPQRSGLGGNVVPVHPGPETAVGTAEMDEMMRQFDAALQEQNDPALDRDMREMLRQQFAEALNHQGAVASLPDRGVWMDAVHALQTSGEIDEEEVNQLIRQINHALEPLQRRESQLAIEFSRRLQSEGQDEALAWFRKESQKDTDDGSAAPGAGPAVDPPPLLRTEVVNSRSRRLRGPPDRSR